MTSFFIRGDWNANVGNPEIRGVTGKFDLGVQNEAGKRLTEFCPNNAQLIINTLFQQHKRWLYTRTSPNSQYQNQTDYIIYSQRWRCSLQLAKTRTGADCSSDHQHLIASTPYIAKLKLQLNKVGKITRPLGYNLNQNPYDYTVQVTNRFQALALEDMSAWRTMDRCS